MSSIPGGVFGQGASGAIYGDIVDGALADIIAQRGSLGIADTLYKALSNKIEEISSRNMNNVSRETTQGDDVK